MRSAAAPFKGPFYYYLAELRKGRSQKYIKRIPKAGGGYRYVYKEHHQGGVGAQEHMKAGAAFKLSFQGQEGHFHIIKAEGDRLIVKHDELHGPDHKGVELTKAELSALLMAEHKPALEADAKKKRARVDKMKRETPRHIGLKRAERLAKEAEARLGKEPAQTEPQKATHQAARLDELVAAASKGAERKQAVKPRFRAIYEKVRAGKSFGLEHSEFFKEYLPETFALLNNLRVPNLSAHDIYGKIEAYSKLKDIGINPNSYNYHTRAPHLLIKEILENGPPLKDLKNKADMLRYIAQELMALETEPAAPQPTEAPAPAAPQPTEAPAPATLKRQAIQSAAEEAQRLDAQDGEKRSATAIQADERLKEKIRELIAAEYQDTQDVNTTDKPPPLWSVKEKELNFLLDKIETLERHKKRTRSTTKAAQRSIREAARESLIENMRRRIRTDAKQKRAPEKQPTAPTPTPTPAPDNFETMPESSAQDNFEAMPEDTAAKASEAAQLLMERINELRNQQSASISEDEALELDEQILDAQLSLRKLERIERKARRAAAKEQAPQAQPVAPPKAEPVKVEPSEAPTGTKTINVTLTNANQINAFKVVSGAKNIKAQNIQGQEYELTASPQDFENALSDLENIIAWEQSGRGGRRTPNAARVKQYRTLRNKLARAVKNAPLIQEEEAPAPKEQTPRAQLLEAAQINIEDFVQQETAPQTAELPPKGQRTAEDAKRFFGEPRKYEQKTGGAKTRKLVKYERDGFAVQGPASGRGKGLFSVTLNYTQSQLSEARAFTEPSSQVLGVFDTLDEALAAAINQHETRQEQTKRLATRTQAQRAEQKRRMLGEQTPRERLTETAREITAPAQTSNPVAKVKREAARYHLIEILRMTRELDGAELNDNTYKGLAYLQAAMSPQRLADMPSGFSHWGFRQREAGEGARNNPWAREFEKYLLGDNKRGSIHLSYANQANIASFIRESMGIKRLADLKGKEAQIKEIAARFARDSFTEAARIAEAAAHRGKARIIEEAGQALDYLVDQLKDGKKELENPRRGAPDPTAVKEHQEIIEIAQQAREHYNTRAAQIKAQAFSRSAFLEALKTSTNARFLVEGRPDGVPSRRKVEELVQEAVQSELEQLINQYRQTDPAPLAPILEEAPAVRRLDQTIDQLA